jgi:hypothetical protein
MADEPLPDDLRKLWQCQTVENAPMPLEEIRRKAERFHRRIRWRNRREYCAAAIVIAAFGFDVYHFADPLARLGAGMIILGTLYAVFQLHRRASAHDLPADLALVSSIRFYRRELVRQRDALRSVWAWYMAPLLPGLTVLAFGMGPRGTKSMLGYFGIIAAVFTGVVWVNHRAVLRLNRQIESLDQLEDQS